MRARTCFLRVSPLGTHVSLFEMSALNSSAAVRFNERPANEVRSISTRNSEVSHGRKLAGDMKLNDFTIVYVDRRSGL
jgi:hypothetical protein